LVLDEPRENDQTYRVEDIDFVVSPITSGSLDRIKSDVLVDFMEDFRGRAFTVRLKERKRTLPA
jgi:hypothetical protein